MLSLFSGVARYDDEPRPQVYSRQALSAVRRLLLGSQMVVPRAPLVPGRWLLAAQRLVLLRRWVLLLRSGQPVKLKRCLLGQ